MKFGKTNRSEANSAQVSFDGSSTVSYQLLLSPAASAGSDFSVSDFQLSAFINVTPQPRNLVGFHQGGDITNDLGILDFSTIPNGIYDLQLIVDSAGAEATATVRFR